MNTHFYKYRCPVDGALFIKTSGCERRSEVAARAFAERFIKDVGAAYSMVKCIECKGPEPIGRPIPITGLAPPPPIQFPELEAEAAEAASRLLSKLGGMGSHRGTA